MEFSYVCEGCGVVVHVATDLPEGFMPWDYCLACVDAAGEDLERHLDKFDPKGRETAFGWPGTL